MTKSNDKELIPLSASRINTLQNCSFLYYAIYNLRLPKRENVGALLGGCVHTVLECLAQPERRELAEFCIKNNCLNISLKILLTKLLNKAEIYSDENHEKALNFIMVALNQDFFFKGADEIYEPEFKFNIKDEKKNFSVIGFIDRHAKYNDEIKILDWKTSKQKFSIDELENNLQALIYQWVIKKVYGLKSRIEFMFLKFPKNPIQTVEPFTKLQFNGLEQLLMEYSDKLSNFSLKDAKSNYAANNPKKLWLCGRQNTAFVCAYRNPFDYYALIDNDGKILKTAFEKEKLKLRPNTHIIMRTFDGCPIWNTPKKSLKFGKK